jgi:uncharacterized protein
MMKSYLRSTAVLVWLLSFSTAMADGGRKLVDAARKQIGVTIGYDPAYVALKYPNGDVPPDRGVCTDVVIRAFREGLGRDLQRLVHEDMKTHFSAYPKNWGLAKPDTNIDHRRVPNLRAYFTRQGWQISLKPQIDPTHFQAGDLVTCMVPAHLPHVMIVSDRKSPTGTPLVIHNIGQGTREEDRLRDFVLTGHFRLK